MNDENLKPFNTLSESEQREIRSKGGKKSGEVRRARKQLKEDLLYLLSQTDNSGDTLQTTVCNALIAKALTGDTQAFCALRDTIGEKPVDNVINNIVSQVNIKKTDIQEALNDINSMN